MRMITVSGQSQQEKFARPHLNRKKLGMVALLSFQLWQEVKIGGSWSILAWANSKTLSPK
jgi:hypothetical protein